MGLGPVWKLRGRAPVSEPRGPEPKAAVERAEPRPTPRRPAPPRFDPVPGIKGSVKIDSADERAARILRMDWAELKSAVKACEACGLRKTCTQTVFGVGDEQADWLLVGEAPGAEEDARGEPFVGQAGRLLDNMLVALGLARGADVYIANVVKCRPPQNRTPEPREVEACLPYLDRQIELLHPRVIVALGKSAATALLDVDATIASLRGRIHRYRNVPLVVTYHPAYLLRNLPDKAKAWEDLLLARRTMLQLREKSGLPSGPA